MNVYIKPPRLQSGLSYAEVLAAVVIIAVTAIPASNAIRSAMHVAESDSLATTNHYRLISRMEEVMARPYEDLSILALGTAAATLYSDAVGTVDRRLVYIAPYDGDNADADGDPFTGTDPGLLWVKVEIEGTVLFVQSLKAY